MWFKSDFSFKADNINSRHCREQLEGRRSESDAPALPSSPSILSNLHFFVQSQVNSLPASDDGSSVSSSVSSSSSDSSPYTMSPTPSLSSSSASSKEHLDDLEAIEVLNALATFESIGSSGGSDEASTLSGSFYLDQPLSPVLEVDEPTKEVAARGSTDDEVFARSSTSEGIAGELETASMDAIASSNSEEEVDVTSVINIPDDGDSADSLKETTVDEDTVIIYTDSPIINVTEAASYAENAVTIDAESSKQEPVEGDSSGEDTVIIDADSTKEAPVEETSCEEDTVTIVDESSKQELVEDSSSGEDTVIIYTDSSVQKVAAETSCEENAVTADAESSEQELLEENSSVENTVIIEADSSKDERVEETSCGEDTIIIDADMAGGDDGNDGIDLNDVQGDNVVDDVDVITMDDVEGGEDSNELQAETSESDSLKDIAATDKDQNALKEMTVDDEAAADASKNIAVEDDTDTDTLINLAIEDDDTQPVKSLNSSPAGSESASSDTLEGFEFVSKEELEVSPASPSSPVVSEEEIMKSTLIVIKLVNGKNEYERVLPLDHDNVAETRKNCKRQRSELLENTPSSAPEDDPVLQEMLESFKVDEILKVMDEPGILDTSSLLNSECGESRSSCVVPSRPSHEKITLDQPGTYDESFDIEEPQSPLISKIDDMIETFKVDVDLTLCPCSSLKACTIL